MKRLVSKKVENFLNTREGRRFFAEISDSEGQQIYDRIKTFVDPPSNVKRWLYWRDKLEKKLKKSKKKVLT